MLKTARTALIGAALAALLVPGLRAQDKGGTRSEETLWVMQYSGGGG